MIFHIGWAPPALAVGKEAAQPLRHGDHPLPHGHRRDDVIGEMGCGLGHVPTVAGGADALSLTGEAGSRASSEGKRLSWAEVVAKVRDAAPE